MWLIQEDVLRTMQEARQSGCAPTLEQQLEFEARAAEARDGAPRNLRLAGDVAEIRIEGVLTKRPSFLAMLFGGGNTTYLDIENALATAKADARIGSAVLHIDSPGGQVDGFFDALAAIQSFKDAKPITVRASRATSAAYGIAAVAGNIEAMTPAAEFGSVGVAVDYPILDGFVTLTNTDSPDKRPDVTTPEGRAVVVKQLDAVNSLFVEAIAQGRGIAVEDVSRNYGRGATLLAAEAQRRGMIDGIAKPVLRALPGPKAQATPAATGVAKTEKKMDLKELKAQHPDAYEAAVQEGIKQERDRVVAHLIMGEKSGAMPRAITAIKAGEGMSMELTAEYLSAGMARADIAARQRETEAAAKAIEGAAPAPSETKNLIERAAAALGV